MVYICEKMNEIESILKNKLNDAIKSIDEDIKEESKFSKILKNKKNKILVQNTKNFLNENLINYEEDFIKIQEMKTFFNSTKEIEEIFENNPQKLEKNYTTSFNKNKLFSTEKTDSNFRLPKINIEEKTPVFNADENNRNQNDTQFTSFLNNFTREALKHKTSPSPKKEEIYDKIDNEKIAKLTKSKTQVKVNNI